MRIELGIWKISNCCRNESESMLMNSLPKGYIWVASMVPRINLCQLSECFGILWVYNQANHCFQLNVARSYYKNT